MDVVVTKDEQKKLDKQKWLRKQVDYKVKVKLGKKDTWEGNTAYQGVLFQ